ncbi:Rft1 protein [Candida orthopsilosis Co 90-125]|uniref:Man(5)GlcNAc(2)-PP-dolichol translocation protein RFT1 n=1 Tax=Candida orthopsilosis (strain 90-125) TaxID=1136231 RepID=H8X4W6_CANO9|nr:Rft1 protein [Candida orthopsilosis Co 90-125]CCG23058.1 Rft1 protein [Candida orthopsilosis Co 90-125]
MERSQAQPIATDKFDGSEADIVDESAKGISSLILVQVITKLFTFLLNQTLIRFVSPDVFGLIVYLEFLQSSTLFISRESSRLAVQRVTHDQTKTRTLQKVMNFGFLPLIIAIPVTLLIGYFQGIKSINFQKYFLNVPFHRVSIGVIILSTILELSIEPIYCVYQYELEFGKRSKFEGIALATKCMTTFGAIYLTRQYFDGINFSGAAILSFMVGQLAYSATLFISYGMSFSKFNERKGTHIKYGVVSNEEVPKFDPAVLSVLKSLFVQSIFKQVLTEGDKLLISHLCTIEEQGVYAVIVNYGSIIARLLFQPLEESTRLLLAKIVNSTEIPKGESLAQSFTYIKMISLFYFNLCLFIMFAGITNGSFLLRIMIGSKTKWAQSNIFDLFTLYVTYIPFLAFNGVFEAFFTVIVQPCEIQRYSKFMTFITAIVLVMSYVLISVIELRLAGLILANIINMAMRICYCYRSINKYYGTRIRLLTCLWYTSGSIICTIASWIVQYIFVFKSESFVTKNWSELFKSTIFSGILLANLLILERQNIQNSIKRIFKIKDE